MEYTDIFAKWDELDGDTKQFRKWLERNGYKHIARVSFKAVYSDGQHVVKFDDGVHLSKWGIGENGEKGHTASEHRAWTRSKNNPARRKYITPSLAYHRGVLIQPLLEDVIERYDAPAEVKRIALRKRFSHYWNFGFLRGKLKFFDVDSSGTGWHNWNKKRKRA